MATPKLEPVFAIAYGPSKRGKTVDCLYSFPNALKIAAPGALKPAEWIGIPQPYVEKTRILVDDIKVLNALVDKIEVKPKRPGEFAACLVDDFSLMAEATFSKLEKNLSGFKLWGALRDLILELRDKGRRKGIHMIFNAHESGARTYQGRFIRGGPKLPGSLPEDFPAACDMVLRAVEDPARSLGWKGAYQCSNIRSDFITGDRHGAAYDLCPMNLGEILRYAGFVLPRLEGMDWAENAVEQISQALEPAFMSENFDKAREINRNAVAQLAQFDPRLVNWALRDAIDRAAIRVAHRKSIHSMFA
jgi:hypothetical protein